MTTENMLWRDQSGPRLPRLLLEDVLAGPSSPYPVRRLCGLEAGRHEAPASPASPASPGEDVLAVISLTTL